MMERRWMLSLYGPTLILVDGAGIGTRNGTYKEVDEVNNRVAYQGHTVPDTLFIRWNTSPAQWEIGQVLGTPDYWSTEDVMSPLQVVTWTAAMGADPAPTVTVYTANTYTTEVFPANTASVKFSWERNLEAGQVFFRKKLDTELVFGGKGRQADFDRFWDVRVGGGCKPFYIRQEMRCGGKWRVTWTGMFGVSPGTFNLDQCTFQVKPDPVDDYTCFLLNTKKEVNILEVDPVEVEAVIGIVPLVQVRSYDRARLLYDVIVRMLRATPCHSNADVLSDFFEWNPPGDAPGYVPGDNYVTGTTNQVDLLYILQKSDAIGLVPPSNPATVAKVTLENLLVYLSQMFNVFWDIDADGNLRIEHWKYWTYPIGLDVPETNKSIEFQTFTGTEATVPRKEEFKLPENPPRTGADYHEDFYGLPIEYSGPCVTTEEVKTTAVPITTDVTWLADADFNGGKDGLVLLACAPNPPSPDLVIRVNGALSAGSSGAVPNVPLSWANLHRDFFTWNRYLPSGKLNGENVDFDGFRPNALQKGVRVVSFCCNVLTFDPSKRVVTALAQRLGLDAALVKSAAYTDQTETLDLTLEYAVP